MDKHGFTVFAGCLSEDSQGARSLKKRGSKRLHVVQMDVTSDDQVMNVQRYVLDHLPKSGKCHSWNSSAKP